MRKYMVLDFLSNYQSLSNAGLIRLIQSRTGIAPANTFLVLRTDQQSIERELEEYGGVEFANTTAESGRYDAVNFVANIISRLRTQLSFGETILVVSYSAPVRGAALAEGRGQVEADSFKSFLPSLDFPGGAALGNGRVVDASRFSLISPPKGGTNDEWHFNHFCPLDEALSAMVRALKKGRFDSPQRSLAIPNLRPVIAENERRFEGNSTMTGTSGMVGELVAVAHSKRIIDLAMNQTGTRFLWLTSNASLAKRAPEATLLPTVAEERLAIAKAETESETESVRPETPKPAIVAQNDSTAKADLKLEHRSRRLEKALHDAGFGPYTTGRLAMYRAIEDLVAAHKGMSFSHILSEAKRMASQSVSTAKPETDCGEPSNNQSWRKIGQFVEVLLTQSNSVLVSKEQPIGIGIRARTATVNMLEDAWRTRADGQIVLRLAELVPDLGQEDHENLAGLLYHSRGRDACDQIEAIVLYLVDSERLTEVEVDGRLLYRRCPQQGNKEQVGLRMAQ